MTTDFIETRVARTKKNVSESFVAVEYVSHKKKVSSRTSQDVEASKDKISAKEPQEKIDPRKQQELEMKRARYDVIKFGTSGLGNVEAKKAKIQNLIALGARPYKARAMNYKKLKEDRLKQKQSSAKKERASGVDKSLVKQKKRRKPRQKDTGVLGVYGKVQKNATRR